MLKVKCGAPVWLVVLCILLLPLPSLCYSPYYNPQPQRCLGDYCGGFRSVYLIHNVYKGVFLTKRMIRERELRHIRVNGRCHFKDVRQMFGLREVTCSAGDGDLCCETIQSHVNTIDTLPNTNGHQQVIVEMFTGGQLWQQWIPTATCVSGNDCHGKCRLKTITVSLLVWNFSNFPYPFEFDTFQIPAYCSCQSN